MKSLYAITLVLSLIIAGCDNPTDNKSTKKEPPNLIAKYKSAGTLLTFTNHAVTKPRRTNSYTQTVTKTAVAEGDEGAITYASNNPDIATVDETTGQVTFAKAEGGTVTITARKAETPKKYQAQKAQYTLTIDHPDGSTIAFWNKTEIKVLRAPFIHTQTARTERDVADDEGAITYKSLDTNKATVNESTGLVTLHNSGKVTITARKAATAARKYQAQKVQYTLTIVKYKPMSKTELVAEIQKATKPELRGMRADLNYIDTSAITDMRDLFSSDDPNTPHRKEGYGLSAFEGDISKWDVSRVTTMVYMFWKAEKFNSNISNWDVSAVTRIAGMFQVATAFKQNLNAWENRINDKIKANNWINTDTMFVGSGLERNLPDWCKKSACKDRQPI